MYMITNIVPSNRKTKRFMAIVKELVSGKQQIIHFGFKLGNRVGNTYIDNATEEERENYRVRHYGNETERRLITGLIPSPSLLSYYLLWGNRRSLTYNTDYLNRLWEKKYLGMLE